MLETVYLSDPQSPLRIEYSRAAMEQIREQARDGLIAAPRVGMGVGGLLLGVREDGRIRLLDSIEIPCSHSGGPSFNLTADEKRESREMIAEAGAPGISGKVGVIGWYCSKTRGDATLNEADLNFYTELFPDPWQVALVVRPSAVEPMRAAFFFRDKNGAVVKGVECDVDEWRPAPNVELDGSETERETEVAVLPPVLPPVLPKVVEIPAPAPKVVETPKLAEKAETRLSDIIEISVSDAGPVTGEPPVRPRASSANTSGLFGVPGLVPPQPLRRRNKLRWVLIAAAALAAGAAAFVTQDSWIPKPPLTLNSTELNGTLLIRWNTDALRGIDHASMFVNDGGQLQTLALDRFQLNSGLLSYTPKSQRVTAKLDAGETSAITAWFAPVPAPAAAQPSPPKPESR